MEDNAVWSEKYKSDRLLLKETTALILTPIRVRANTKNAPDEAGNFPERKVNVNREIADN